MIQNQEIDGPARTDGLLARIRSLDKLTRGEARIAEFFERVYPLTALESVTSISLKAGVGKATVVRFISRLGYDGFKDFQERLHQELACRLESPFERVAGQKRLFANGEPDWLGRHVAGVAKSLRETHARINPEDLLAAARMLADCKGAIYVQGQGGSHALAYLFWVHAMYLKDRVHLIRDLGTSMPHQLVDIGPRDVLLAITHHRYSQQTVLITRWFSQRKCRIILLTDREVMPLSDLADIKLVVSSEKDTIFYSHCASLAVLEALITATAPLLEEKIKKRSRLVETLFEDFSIFAPWPGAAKLK